MIGLDYDLPGKVEWSDHWRAHATDLFTKLTGSALARPSVFYTTAHGFRLFYFLARPVPINKAGGLHDLLLGLLVEAFGHGLDVDANCRDWTRMFRLSRVWRRKPHSEDKGHPTWEADYFRQSWGRVDLSASEPAPPEGKYLVYEPSALTPVSALTVDEMKRRAWNTSGPAFAVLVPHLGRVPGSTPSLSKREIGTAVDWDWQRWLYADTNSSQPLPAYVGLRKILERACTSTKAYDADPLAAWVLGVLFQGVRLYEGIESGKEGMHQALSTLIRMLCRFAGEKLAPDALEGNAQFLHAVVLQAALLANSKMPLDRQRTDQELHGETWRLLEHHYRRLLGHREQREVDKSEVEQLERVIALNAFREHRDELVMLKKTLQTFLVNKCPEAEAWIEQQASKLFVIECADGTSVLQRTMRGNLRWTNPWGKANAIPSLIRDSGLSNFTAMKPGPTPEESIYKQHTQIIDEYGTVATSIRASRHIERSGLDLRWDGESMSVGFVEKWGGMRKDIKSIFHADIDGWLRALAGSEMMYHHLLDWLHFYPQIQHRICALYIYGNSGVGKTVLGLALQHLTEFDTHSSLDIASSNWQENMVASPLMWTEEFHKEMPGNHRTAVDYLKRLVDGASEVIARKYKVSLTVEGYWRIYISGNDKNIIRPGRDITQDTQKALLPRLLFLDASNSQNACAKYIPQMMPERWAEELVPQHIMWLRNNHVVMYPGTRYAKDGFWSKEHDELLTTSKSGKLILETVGRLLVNPGAASRMFKVHDGMLWVHIAALSDKVREDVKARDIDHEQVRQTIRQYAATGHPNRTIRNAAGEPVFMMQMDAVKLFAYFHEHEMLCDFSRFVNDERLWEAWAPPKLIADMRAVAPVPPRSNIIHMRPQPPQAPPPPPMIGVQSLTQEHL